MVVEQQKRQRRWYERNPVVNDAMKMWEAYPIPLQKILAREVTRVINEAHPNIRLYGMFLPFSVKKLKAVYKSLQCRRWYDRDPLVRSTVQTMSFMPHNDLVAVCRHIVNLDTFMRKQNLQPAGMDEREIEKAVRYVFQTKDIKFYKKELAGPANYRNGAETSGLAECCVLH